MDLIYWWLVFLGLACAVALRIRKHKWDAAKERGELKPFNRPRHRMLFVGAVIAAAAGFEILLYSTYGAAYAIDEARRFLSVLPWVGPVKAAAPETYAFVHRVQIEVGMVYALVVAAYVLHIARSRTCWLLVNGARESLRCWLDDVGSRRSSPGESFVITDKLPSRNT